MTHADGSTRPTNHPTAQGRYRPYPEYRDSRVEWLGEIPVGWEVVALKLALSTPITDGPHETPEFLDEGIPFLSAESVKKDRLDFSKKRGFISYRDHARFSKKYRPKPGDVYMVKSGATTGNVARVQTTADFNIWSPLAAMRPHTDRLTTDFLFFFMKSKPFFTNVELSWSFGTQQNIGMGVISNLSLVLPPLPEQRAIAAFLDRETGKIDALVEKKERLIELLQEKRTAMITHAVTKGLAPDAPMKDSGVEWLGEIPARWEVRWIKQISEILRGKFTHRPRNDPAFYDGAYPFIQTGEVSRAGRMITSFNQTLNERGLAVSKMFPRGTLVMTIAANIGDVAILDFEACFPDSVVGFVPRANVERDFLYYVFCAMKRELLRDAPVTAQGNLNVDRIGARTIGLPPVSVQCAIAAFMDRETQKIDALVEKVRQAIARLKEYRTALISAAVTGKIDVRDATDITHGRTS